MKIRIVPHKDLGRPPRGYIYGKVTRLAKRNDPTGEPYWGFGGLFEASPYDNKYPTVQGGVLFLPKPVADLIRKPFEELKKKGNGATLVIRLDVQSTDKGLQFTPIGTFEQSDPLAEARAGLPERKQAKRR